MTDYDYGYWIMRQNGAPVAAIRNTVLTEAKAGRFTRFGSGVRDSVIQQQSINKAESAFLAAYHAVQMQRQIASCA